MSAIGFSRCLSYFFYVATVWVYDVIVMHMYIVTIICYLYRVDIFYFIGVTISLGNLSLLYLTDLVQSSLTIFNVDKCLKN